MLGCQAVHSLSFYCWQRQTSTFSPDVSAWRTQTRPISYANWGHEKYISWGKKRKLFLPIVKVVCELVVPTLTLKYNIAFYYNHSYALASIFCFILCIQFQMMLTNFMKYALFCMFSFLVTVKCHVVCHQCAYVQNVNINAMCCNCCGKVKQLWSKVNMFRSCSV